MNVTTRKVAQPDRTWTSPLAAFKETATNRGYPFLQWTHLVTHVRANIEDSLIR